ncbi:type II toxin-antitoxin system PemK/MazF family toxin [Sulfurimonas sp. SAG-AH-194-C21]|nr:type II toxin-antitoxin system PemK/MazF family toxin [Sulfurimonas sp. SAG-AH-194-C21]MDF1882338.1 type II toxin-antitoxin system PemK/MazF family toxin [Sulfurimonas sp. SAG-AH-194-C21]
MKRGEIYLVNFGKKYNSEFGKVRPALIIQNDIANRNIDKVDFKGVTLIPLTSRISQGNLRVCIEKRDKLEERSEICINELCTLDMSRIKLESLLTELSEEEISEVNRKLLMHLAL